MTRAKEYHRTSLKTDDVLHWDSELRLANTADGRLLVRHSAGTTLRSAVDPDDLMHVLRLVDGRRTVAEVVAACVRFEAQDVFQLLQNLTGDVLHLQKPAPKATPVLQAEIRPHTPRRVGIIGGGTAGYLTALALRAKLPKLDVTLIQSSKIPVIGVGEATTPLMPQFLHADLGLDIRELFAEVRPTFKLGIRFLWGSDGGFNYPFGSNRILEPLRFDNDLTACSFLSMMMQAGVLPLTSWRSGVSTEHWNPGTEFAYHLDNRRFVSWLQCKALERGVQHIDARIVDAFQEERGISALVDENGDRHVFDSYIDCTGFAALLIGRQLGSPFRDFANSLFLDRAWTGPVPRSKPPFPHTTAETMDAGWCWNVPQLDEDHVGYVFCSRFLDDETARAELLRRYPAIGEPRLLHFQSGRREHFLLKNVAAMGNAYGFVEPLESTALHMLIRQIGLLLPLLAGEPVSPDRINRRLASWWDYLCWFLAVHYRYNRRRDTSFWQTCRQEVDVSAHEDLIHRFRQQGPLAFQNLPDYLGAHDPLWGPEGVDIILAGQGVACPLPDRGHDATAWSARREVYRQLILRSSSVEAAMRRLQENPGELDELATPFLEKGPAFP
ncbi:MAG: tryptophan 7-halogenase [Acidobacteriota bacterium]|nr:tryptophan 7-halogenase [Acidobacteriota bacterium]